MPSDRKTGPERRADLLVQKLGEEAIVYDPASHRAHSLNRTAALVFEKLDGKRSLADLARVLGKSLGRSRADEIVASAVNDLAEADLLRPGAELPRRSVLRGLALSLLPAVVSIAVPKAASAQSCIALGDACSATGTPCCGDPEIFECDDPSGTGGICVDKTVAG